MQRLVAKSVTEYLQEDAEEQAVPQKPKTPRAMLVTWKRHKVITTSKMARLFRVDEVTIRTLFSGNSSWFRESVDFFRLTELDLEMLRCEGSRAAAGMRKAMMLWSDSGAGRMSQLIPHKLLRRGRSQG